MICDLLTALPLPGYSLSCQSTGLAATLAQITALLAAVLSTAWAIQGPRAVAHRIGGMAVTVAALLLAVSSGVPAVIREGTPPAGGRVAVVLDQSESLRRDGDTGYDAARSLLSRRIAAATQDRGTTEDGSEVWEGRVFGFSGGRQALGETVPLSRLPATVTAAQTGKPGGASDLAGGLSEAISWISEGPGPGEVFLLSDGWFTEADPAPDIARAAGRGLPIHVLAFGSDSLSEGLIAWNLGPEQIVAQPAVARLVTRGPGVLAWSVDGNEGAPVALTEGIRPQPLRLPLSFPARGFSHLSITHSVNGKATRTATDFTLVRGPARLLVYGPGLWADTLPPARFSVTHAQPGEQQNLPDFDVIALDGLEPDAFDPAFVPDLLSAATGGTGLFIVNGPQRGDVTDPQRMSDWEATGLGPVLPVNSDPDYVLQDPPPRVVLIIIDTSGSMAGDNATRGRQAAKRVIEFLRPGDSLRILPFSDGVGRPFEATNMTMDAANRARAYIDALVIGGGTNMNSAITAAASLRGTNCDLFVIGDGGYPAGQVNTSPICKTTAIGVEGSPLPGFDTSWGQQIPLGRGQQLGAITFETFEPEPRLEFWREGPLDLRAVEMPGPFDSGGRITGVSLAYARPESDVVMIPDTVPPDPALIFRDDPEVPSLRTSVFVGDLTNVLPERSLLAALDRLTGWSEPDRFDIRLRLVGERLFADIATAAGKIVPLQLSLSLRYPDGRSLPFAIDALDQPGTFYGSVALTLKSETETVILALQTGDRRAQLIPLRLPAMPRGVSGGRTREKDSIGVNAVLLAKITRQTGGVDLAADPPRDIPVVSRPESRVIWPFFAALALAFLTLGLWFGGARR